MVFSRKASRLLGLAAALSTLSWALDATGQSSAPTNVTATPARTQVYLSWNSVSNATSYNIKRSTTSGGPYSTIPMGTPQTFFLDTGLTSGTTYYYVITASGTQESPASSQVSATPSTSAAPDAPASLSATPASSQITLSWSAASGAGTYSVRRSTTNGGPYTEVGTPSPTTFTDTGLTNNTTYYYVVHCVNGSTGPKSLQVSATPIGSPTGVTATAAYEAVILSWDSSTGATSYNVKRATASGGPYTTVGSPTQTTFTDTGRTNGTTYYYVVCAAATGFESANSSQVSAQPLSSQKPAPPLGLMAVSGDAKATLSWNAAAGATSYKVKTGSWPFETVITTTSNLSYVHTGLNNGQGYSYYITASNGAGESNSSAPIEAYPNAVPPTPLDFQATAYYSQVGLTWSWSGGGVVTFSVKRATVSGGPYTTIASGLTGGYSGSYGDASVSNGTSYYYVVSASNAYGESGNSLQQTGAPTTGSPPAGPSGLTAIGGDSKVLLTWNPTAGANTYILKHLVGGSYNFLVTNISTPYYTVTGLTNLQGKTFKVMAIIGESNTGPDSLAASATPYALGAPTNVVATAGYGEVLLTWAAPSGASSFVVKRATQSGGPYTTVASGITTDPGASGSYYSDRNLTNATTYFYKVYAVDYWGEGPGSSQVQATPATNLPPGPPIGLSASGGNGQISLTWMAAAGAQTYTVLRSSQYGGSGSYDVIASGIAVNSYINTGVSDLLGLPHWYKVRAINAAGTSPDSNVASAVSSSSPPPLPPTSISALPGNNNSQISWTASNGATSYKVKKSTVSGGPYTVVGTPTGTSFIVNGLSNNSTYYFVVTAVNANGESGNSSEVSSIYWVAPSAPTNLVAMPGDAQVSLVWNETDATQSYNVKRATVSGGPYSTIASVTTTTYTNTGLTNGTTYYYVISAVNPGGESGNSNEASALPEVPSPSGLTAVSHGSRVDLTWNPPSGTIAGYNVYRSTNSVGPFTLKVSPEIVTDTHYEDAAANGTYYYVVRTLNTSSQESSNSPIASATVNSIAPPTGLTAIGLDAKISLSWNSVSGAILYGIYRGTTSGGPYDVTLTTPNTTFLDVNLVGGQTYYYIVTAYNSAGQGLPTAEVNATPTAQSTFDALLVVGNTTLNSGDAALQTRLANLGFSVVVLSDSAATSASATGKAVVVISATVNASNVGTQFTGVPVPVLSCSSGTFYALGMTESTSNDFGTSGGETQIAMSTGSAASHPMAAQLTGTITVHSSPPTETLSWGVPSFSAYSIASLVSNTSRKTIFGYEAGDPFMPGTTAPARRVGFFLSSTGAAALMTDGGVLFDAAARWAADTAIAIPTLRTVASGGEILIQWEPSPNALSYRIYRSTSETGTFTEIASGVTFTSFIDTAASLNTTYYYKIVAQNSGGFSSPSVVVSGARNSSPIVVTVDGPPNLEVFSGSGSNDSAAYTATVKQYINGVPTDVSFTSSWSFASVPNNETGSVTIQNSTSNPCTIAATSSRGTAVILFTATVGGTQYSTTFSVQAGGIRRPTMYFQFPLFAPIANLATDPLRTRRDPASYQNGVLWDEPENNNEVNARRGTARHEIWDRPGNSYSNTITNIWRPANIQFYFEQANNATGLILNPAEIDINTVTAGPQAGTRRLLTHRRLRTPNGTGGFNISYEYTQIVRDLQARNSAQHINVYFVRNLYSESGFDGSPTAPAATRGQLDGFTYEQVVRGPNRLTILVADHGDGETIAHETGHAIGLDHVRRLEDVDGGMNAAASLTTGANRLEILSANLMWQTQGGVQRSGTQLMPNQIGNAQREMDAMKRNNPKLLTFPDP